MRKPVERENVQKESVLKKCFECLVANGLEGASINNFSSATGMTASSLYYWFEDKDEIVLDAIEYGMTHILGKIFEYAKQHIDNVEEMFAAMQDTLDNAKAEFYKKFEVKERSTKKSFSFTKSYKQLYASTTLSFGCSIRYCNFLISAAV